MKDVLNYLNSILKPQDTIIIGVSGGADSMCLLHLLLSLKPKLDLNLIIAHVNHKLRVEADQEALFVKEFCKQNNVIFEYSQIDSYDHQNIEKTARDKRYEFFSKLATKYHAKYLLTAHHGDDLIETVMMRLIRGSNLKGYSGFKEISVQESLTLIRPLLKKTKAEIVDFMQEHNYTFYTDQSNFNRKYTRNRLRLDLLPILKQENPKIHLKIRRFSEELEEANNFIMKYVHEALNNVKTKEGWLDINLLKTYDLFIIKNIINEELANIYQDNLPKINNRHTLSILNLLFSSKSNASLNLPNDYLALKEYNYLKIAHNKPKSEFYYIFETEVKREGQIIRKLKTSSSNNNSVIRLNSKELALPLIVRSRRDGDKMAVKNLLGTKKVKDILIDEKIPKSKRDCLLVLTDSNNQIIWLPGVKKSKFDIKKNGIYDIILAYEEE